ncbi:MAG: sensor histidine kinase [Eubacteriales bacterium]|nr:sensor histidine kinase [Eubacteriales bacterium]
MGTWWEYCKKIRKTAAFIILCCGIMGTVLYLYDLPAEPVAYGAILCAIAGLASFFHGYHIYKKKQENLLYVQKNLPVDMGALSSANDKNEEIYQEMLTELNRLRMEAESGRMRFYGELTDYYTMWVHQIKTPISAMRLLLGEDREKNREALGELFKVEQYVEMVLGYLRTEDISSDMKFQECSLDRIVREQIHKYAHIFIGKKLALEYDGVEETVLTDAKWLGFVIGQLLSNALKYTPEGKISVYLSESRPHTLVIADTGIGIRPEDLPRVFEKGFTGCNGREESRSTGIGLYLSAKIMKKLGHKISIESTVGEGTRVYLSLGRKSLELFS